MRYIHVGSNNNRNQIDTKLIFWICVFISSLVFFALFSDICFPFICGFILAYIFVPIVDYLSKYTKLSRSFFSILIVITTIMIFVVGFVVIIPRLKDYIIFMHGKIPEYYSIFMSFINKTVPFIDFDPNYLEQAKIELQKFLEQKIYLLASVIEELASKGKEITKFFSFFVILPISLFYFLKDWNSMISCIYDCLPVQQKSTIQEIFQIIRNTVHSFFYWQFYIVFTLFTYYALGLRCIGIEQCIYLALVSGLLSFIPFIGCVFSCFLVIFISIPILTLNMLYAIIGLYFLGQFIEGYVLYPHFVGKKTGLHPLWIIFSFFAGIEVKGIIGVFIAIPSAAIIRSLGIYIIEKFKATQTYKQ